MIKKLSIFIICLLVTVNIPITSKASEDIDYIIEMKQDILTLMLAYPDYIVGVEKNNDDKVYLIMKSGKKIIYDDKIEKSHEEKLENPDLQDMLEQDYPLDKSNSIMDKTFDPGRARHYELLSEVYGNSRKSIESNLISLKYGYTNYQFNSKNNANTSLEAALKELIPLSKTRGDIGSILYPASGTYNYRVISGTGRLSPHSYGIAIDLKSDKKDYWKWSSDKEGEKRLSQYPKELVEAFEKNNFVWGGKWGHFDILHFEYRPEIILKAKYFSTWNNNSKWYEGAPLEEEATKKYIDIIEQELQ
ncbi:M15 family metallopeptidase [Clostridium uliginosum]|uniref:D-alanyl-D-alanine carboxypeptidase n=1 Tax=Clostridium uliginosum TaxID=119641 RepID=A0A1I1H1C7_9CLOT|nr:M15 family metallopeptidase [Clostridium uliginosum]SFC17949.1 D-alanyl-D-alanine carboxypeptidase [Clostridium uliginosum]